jgi:hypothetical protein
LSRQKQNFAFCSVKVERAMGIETIAHVILYVFARVSATVKRTKTHSHPRQLLQIATTRRQWQAFWHDSSSDYLCSQSKPRSDLNLYRLGTL